MMHRDFIYTEGLEKLHQNSVNLTHMGPDRCQIIKYSGLSDCTEEVLTSNFLLLLLYTSAVQLIERVFHLGIFLI